MTTSSILAHEPPEHQRNPNTRNLHVPKPAKEQRKAHVKIPGLTAITRNINIKQFNKDAIAIANFKERSTIREVTTYMKINITCASYFNVIELTYNQILRDKLVKSMIPEAFTYYAAPLLWFRIISIKNKTSKTITPIELRVLEALTEITYPIPETIQINLNQI